MFYRGNSIATEADKIHFEFNIRKEVCEKRPPATRVNKSLKEISSCNFRFGSLLAPFRGTFKKCQWNLGAETASQWRVVDVSSDPNWTNLISGVCRDDILREKPGKGLKACWHLRSISSDAAPRSHLAKSNDYFGPDV